MEGWVKLFRKLIEWEWYKDKNVKILFLHLLLTANYEDKEWKGEIIKKGQLVTSRDKLSKELGLSDQELRTALKKLKSTGEISIKSTNKYTIITIENWDKFQEKKQVDEQPTNNQQNNQQTTNNSANELTNKKDDESIGNSDVEENKEKKVTSKTTNEETENQPTKVSETNHNIRNNNKKDNKYINNNINNNINFQLKENENFENEVEIVDKSKMTEDEVKEHEEYMDHVQDIIERSKKLFHRNKE